MSEKNLAGDLLEELKRLAAVLAEPKMELEPNEVPDAG